MTFLEKLRCLFSFGQGVALPLPDITPTTQPLALFEQWFKDANKAGILLAESMSASTCDSDGQPKSRMVLLKEFNENGLVFYTNFHSDKSLQLKANNKIALLFHWGVLQRQVRIEGLIEKVDHETAKKYFHSRDRGSQIGAWASKQSKIQESPDELQKAVKYYQEKFKDKTVPLPDFWGGWRVKPHYFEFWQGRTSRLHDRLCFEKNSDNPLSPWVHFKRNP